MGFPGVGHKSELTGPDHFFVDLFLGQIFERFWKLFWYPLALILALFSCLLCNSVF